MKNTRKKMLLSSVAMLLVALVALGSATYAWFSLNTTVSADTMTVKAAASKGLEINIKNQADGQWKNSDSYTGLGDAARTITPVSIDYSTTSSETTTATALPAATAAFFPNTVSDANGLVWSSTNADKVKDWNHATAYPTVAGDTGDEGVGYNDYFVAYEFAIRGKDLADDEEFTGVKAKISFTDGDSTKKISDFARVALVKESSTTPAFTGSNSVLKGVVGSESGANAISAIDTVATEAQALVTPGTGEIALDNVSTATNYVLLVWFEGQDTQCVNSHVASDGQISISITAGAIGKKA
jgi:hypothetical protein